jgi:uncharacterized membrane protein YgcG
MRRLAAAALVALAATVIAAPFALADHVPAVADRVEGRSVYDDGLLGETLASTVEEITGTMADLHRVEMIVVTRRLPAAVAEPDEHAALYAEAIVDAWGLGRAVVLVVEAGPDGCNAGAAIWTVGQLDGASIDAATIVTESMRPAIERCDPAAATLDGVVGIVSGLVGVATSRDDPTGSTAGPPFPDPEIDRAVYDQAGVFSADTIARAEATIDAIEARTGAEVVVYSQVVDYGITTEEADRHARALMDQWGVGRKGFDDGLVILFDLDPSLVHGQVQLYGGPGYRAAFLDNGEKQRIFDEDMVPRLEAGDLDGALLIALERVDANATPEHAARLQTARQLDAAMGLIGAPIILVGLLGSAVFAWLRYGRDPVYLDDPSIHMAGPPRDLTPAAATFVMAGEPTRRALTTAMLDLASRGHIAFREERGLLGLRRKIGIQFDPPAGDAATEAQRARNAVRDLGPAEQVAHGGLRTLAKGAEGYIDPDELLKFGTSLDDFNESLESHAVKMGWFREKPSKADARWSARGVIAIVLGFVSFWGAINLPSAGLTMIAAAFAIGGVLVLVMSRWMDAVTMPGAMIRAMLAAYRRTLQKTMAQSRSMDQVVAKAGLDWLETPDQAVVWGTALGLEKEIEDVLERSLDDVKDGRAAAGSVYMPTWYGSGGSGAWAGSDGGGGGLFSSSAAPNLGGMMAAIGTIGNSPSSSGSGGGFGGGGSGGGGGGSGGGF